MVVGSIQWTSSTTANTGRSAPRAITAPSSVCSVRCFCRPGLIGGEIYAAAAPLVKKSKHHNHMEFLAHGMGMVSHEAPRLTDRGPVPYPAEYAAQPLESGMVVSVETTLMHPTRGFIKLEDTVVVTDQGHEVYGEGARGWNRAGVR